jgi:hypothetical protein
MEAVVEVHSIQLEKGLIDFGLKRSNRKTLAIAVQPDTAVLVTAPRRADLDVIKFKVRRRALWIRRQQTFFRAFLPPIPERRYVGGETHRYLGRQYRLKFIHGAEEGVKLKGQFFWVIARRKDPARVRALLKEWYAASARKVFERSLITGIRRLNGRVKDVPRVQLRGMPKRWGSCTKRGLIYLNPELVKAPVSCVDYVLIHELCHLLHPNHGRDFYALLRRMMPDWETRKARLERLGVD